MILLEYAFMILSEYSIIFSRESISYWMLYWFDHQNDIFQYQSILVYRFEFTIILYIYIYRHTHICVYMCIIIVRTSFDLGSKTGVDLGPTSSNNKFVESGRKSQPESRKMILVLSVQEEELYEKNTKIIFDLAWIV